jgi:hypothetical protein
MGLNDHGNATNLMSIADADIKVDVVGVVRGRQEPWYGSHYPLLLVAHCISPHPPISSIH